MNFCSLLTDMISVQPDLTQTMVSIPYQSATPSPEPPNNNHVSSVENIYDKPDINLDNRHSNSLINAGQPYAESSISNHSVSNHSHHSGDQMSDKNTMTMSAIGGRPPSFSDSAVDNRNSMVSVQLPNNIDMEAVTWGTFNHMGGRLVLQESGRFKDTKNSANLKFIYKLVHQESGIFKNIKKQCKF